MNQQQRAITGLLIAGIIIVLVAGVLAVVWKVLQERPGQPQVSAPETLGPNFNLGGITGFQITITPPQARVGDEVSVAIVAVDKQGQAVTGYTGQVMIKSDLLDLPLRSRFLPGDVGRHQFKAAAIKAGTASIKITDPATGIISSSEPFIVIESPDAINETPLATNELPLTTSESPLSTGESPQ